MKTDEPNYETLEEAKEALQKAYADFVGHFVYKGEGYNAFGEARWLVDDLCYIAKEKILGGIRGEEQ